MLSDTEYAAVAYLADQRETQAERALRHGDAPVATAQALLALSTRLELIHEVLHALPERLAIDRKRGAA